MYMDFEGLDSCAVPRSTTHSKLLFIITITCILNPALATSFTSVPSNPTYAVKGDEILLNWTYVSATTTSALKRWYQAESSGGPINPLIMVQVGSNQPTIKKASYVDRASYVANAGLRITNVSIVDESPWKFDVTFNDGFTLEKMISLIVTIPPTIVTGLANATAVFEGAKSSLQCVFDTRPVPTVKWHLDSVELTGSRYNINTTTIGNVGDSYRVMTTLMINQSQPIDTGIISCAAILPNSRISSQTKHVVYYAPRNTSLSSNQAYHIGRAGLSATITCQAHGNPTIFYQIYKDGSLIRNTTNGVYQLNSVTLQDEAVYSCTPINYLGEGPRRELNFTVHLAPALDSYTGNLTRVLLGMPVSIYCTFVGKPAPNVTWTKHGANLPPSSYVTTNITNTSMRFVVRSQLLFTKTSKSDSGVYQCLAENAAGSVAQNISLDVRYAPILNESLRQNYTLIEDKQKNVSWVCRANGNPESTIMWYMNGTAVADGYDIRVRRPLSSVAGYEVESTLTMAGISQAKAGSLTCNASNAIGNAISTTTVIIQFVPSIMKIPDVMNVTLNESIIITCHAEGLPPPQIRWEKDGIALNDSGAIIVETVLRSSSLTTMIQSNLTIDRTRKNNYGSYQCIAVNKIGNSSMATHVNILYKPEFLTSPSIISLAQEGSRNFKLECRTESNPTATITWFRNGSIISSNNDTVITTSVNNTPANAFVSSVLTFKMVGRNHYGNYSCRASNSLGFIMATTELVVNYQPFILQSSPNMVSANASSTVTLFCIFKSNPQATVLWTVQNQRPALLSYPNTTTTQALTTQYSSVRSEITIMNSTRFDNGLYSCAASNSLAMVTWNITLVVYFAPFNDTSLSGSYIAVEGTSLILNCSFVANPLPSVYWKYNQSMIKDSDLAYNKSAVVTVNRSDRTKTVTGLIIQSVKKEMQGNYECSSSNHQGSATLITTLIVYYKPIFTSAKVDRIILNTSDNVTLSCAVESNPASSLSWMKDGVLLSNSTYMPISNTLQFTDKFKTITFSTIQINLVNKTSTGNYSCRATNFLATEYQSTKIIVKYSPEITTNFGKQENLTEFSTSKNFTCTVESHPASTIQWYKNGLRYNGTTTSMTLTSTSSKTIIQSSITFANGLHRSDFGMYTCTASNAVGNASEYSYVNVRYAPEFQSNLTGRIDIRKTSNVSFICIAQAHPAPRVDWYKNDKKPNSANTKIVTITKEATASKTVIQSTITISDVMKNDTAVYKCQASNIVANRHQSVSLNVQFRPQLLVASTNVTVNESNPVTLRCLSDANPPAHTHIWSKDGRKISESGPTYSIASAKHSSSGTYSCIPVNSLGNGTEVSFVLLVRIPPTFTSIADCKPQRQSNKVVCTCEGAGVPTPSVFWTKNDNRTIIAVGNTFEQPLNLRNIDGRYNCHVKNILGEKISTSNFFYWIQPVSLWGAWGACNASRCSRGYQTRSRTCQISSCIEHLSELKPCNATCPPPVSAWGAWGKCNASSCGRGYYTRSRTCQISSCSENLFDYKPCNKSCVGGSSKMKKDEAWVIALYVLIPILVVLLVIFFVWIARANRKKDQEDPVVIPVNGNLSKPPSVRSVPTRRDIYLPENSFATVNRGYMLEEKEFESTSPEKNDKDFETVEVEMAFKEDSSNSSVGDVDSKDANDNKNTEEAPKQVLLKQENPGGRLDDDVDTYYGPDDGTVGYSFYNELSTAL